MPLKGFVPFKINSSHILSHSSSIAISSVPIFEWEVAFVLFSKTPHIAQSRGLRSGLESCLIAVFRVFLWSFNSLAYFLIDVVGSLIAKVQAVKKPSSCFLFNLLGPFALKSSFSEKKSFLWFEYSKQKILAWFRR